MELLLYTFSTDLTTKNTRQKYDVRRISFLICFLFPDECAFETAGRSIVDIAIVIVAGNIINGIAIPEYIPYTLKASFIV